VRRLRFVAFATLLTLSSCVTLHLPEAVVTPEVKAGSLVAVDEPVDARTSTKVAVTISYFVAVTYFIGSKDVTGYTKGLIERQLALQGFRVILTPHSAVPTSASRTISVRITKAEMWDNLLLFILSHIQNPIADATIQITVRDQFDRELLSKTYAGTGGSQGTHQTPTLDQSLTMLAAGLGAVSPRRWYEEQISWALDDAVWTAVHDPSFLAVITTSP
jgi:hypothetical protein